MLAEGAAFAERWHARFRRRYLVDESGVRLATSSGLQPVPGLKIAWKASSTRATFEASMPALALPLCGEAPVTVVAMSAAPSLTATPPADDPSRWALHSIEPPIGFEPYADHRALLFDGSRVLAWVNGPLPYQPGDPNTLERAGYASQDEFPYSDRMRREVFRSELVTKERSFGELEVGRIEGQDAAVWRGAKLLGTGGGDARAWVERDGELFGVSWSQWTSEPSWTVRAHFEAFAIRADGSFREQLVHPVEPRFEWASVDEMKPSKDLRTLVIRGVATGEPDPPRRTTVVTWTSDPTKRDWRPTVRHTPRAPAPP